VVEKIIFTHPLIAATSLFVFFYQQQKLNKYNRTFGMS